MSQVCPKVINKYRESEMKHGRLAMLACVGMCVQESFHPLFPEIGGLAITHMDQLYHSDHGSGLIHALENLLSVKFGKSTITLPVLE